MSINSSICFPLLGEAESLGHSCGQFVLAGGGCVAF